MSAVAILCLSAIIGAFVLFAVVLAWGDYQTRNITRPIREEKRGPGGTAAAAATPAATETRELVRAA